MKGYNDDGKKYVGDAIKNGAIAIVLEDGTNVKELEIPENTTVFLAKDIRACLAKMSCNFYSNPSKEFTLIGVTGTKGKTTTTYMIKHILEKEGKKVGLIGTIATYIGEEKIENSDRTTPESTKIQKLFRKMADEKVDVVVMEVSSQSLMLHRVDYCDFDIGVFTNLSEDHISEKEHKNMQEYFEEKLKLFNMCKIGFTNADDIYTSKLKKLVPNCNIMTYGIDNHCDYLAKDITITNSYADFKARLGDRNERIKVGIPGRFSVYNGLAAICVTQKLGATKESIKDALLTIRVPGRSEIVENKRELTIMIDYAHTPESLENILKAVKEYTRGRVISVFGCGGDRDRNKRHLMGEISGRIADVSIITSDNPRTEKPEAILDEIENGIKKTKGKYIRIENRKEAIRKAISMANKMDIIVIAGKGHEMYQEIGNEKIPFDERKVIKEIIDNM